MPWVVLANAAEEYTEWQVFALWVRAVLDACEGLPAEVAAEVETRSPDLFSRIASAVDNVALSRGSVAWEIVTDWVESNAFVRAKRERWLNAIRYFSSRSLSSMKAWSHWEDMHRQWREKKPETLPTYEVWVSAASAVGRLSNPESDAQKVLDSIRLVPEEKWQQMFDAFAELTTLCLWIEILLGAGKTGAELVAEELAVRYPRFDTCSIQNRPAAISSFAEWVLAHEPPFANAQQFLFALSYQTNGIRHTTQGVAMRHTAAVFGVAGILTGYHRLRTGEVRRTRTLRASLSRTFQRMIPQCPRAPRSRPSSPTVGPGVAASAAYLCRPGVRGRSS